MLRGKNTYIRLMEENDVHYKVKWFNDDEVRKTLNVDFPISEIGTKKWLHQVVQNPARKDFIICSTFDDKPIGYVGLVNIDLKNRKAESYLGIGDKSYWGKGHASEARRLILDYAFDELALNRVYSYVWSENLAMQHINEKVGFKREGILRSDIYYKGEYRDKILMSILKSEYAR